MLFSVFSDFYFLKKIFSKMNRLKELIIYHPAMGSSAKTFNVSLQILETVLKNVEEKILALFLE